MTPEPRIAWPTQDDPVVRLVGGPASSAIAYEVEASAEPATLGAAGRVDAASPALHRAMRPAAGRYRVPRPGRGPQRPSAWSSAVRVAVADTARASSATARTAGRAPTVHAALLRMCAARGDLFALLSLPRGGRAGDVLDHVDALRAGRSRPIAGTPATCGAAPDADPPAC